MINGSSFQKDQRSDMSVGSDIDILVITTAVGTESKLLDLNHKIKEKTKVPVEFVPISLEMAQAGEHNIDFFYKQYLETYCMDGIIGNNPLEAIAPREEWENPSKEVKMVFRANLLQMAKRRAKCENFTDEHCTLLEKMLRQPLYSVIDMLRLARGSYPNENGKPLPKRRCLELYSGEFPEGFAEEAFAVMDMRDKYRAFLLESNFKSPSQYISLLREINAIYQPARKVIMGNLRILKNKYKV